MTDQHVPDPRVGMALGILAAYGDNPEPTPVDFEFLVHHLRVALDAAARNTADPADGLSEDEWNAICRAAGEEHSEEACDALKVVVERILAARQRPTRQADTDRAVVEAPFLSVPSGIDIAHYFWEETEHRNPGCDGIDLYRDGADYCYLWVDTMVDFDMWHAFLLDVRTERDGRETRDYLFLMAGAGGMFEVEWHNQPIGFEADVDDHWVRHHAGVKWMLSLAEKAIEDRDSGAIAAASEPTSGHDERSDS